MPTSWPGDKKFRRALDLYQTQLEQVERDLAQPDVNEQDRRILSVTRAVLQRKVRWFQIRGTLGLQPKGVFTTLQRRAARKARLAAQRAQKREEAP